MTTPGSSPDRALALGIEEMACVKEATADNWGSYRARAVGRIERPLYQQYLNGEHVFAPR